MDLVFATNNRNKLNEVQMVVGNRFRLLTLKDIGCAAELPETGSSLEANAKQKARYVHDRFKANCFADDTGLEVEALNGAPGVLSARYAGEEKSAEKNIEKLLKELSGKQNRKACFKTIIALIINNKEYLFEGSVNGIISNEKSGNKGFGYDPVFFADGQNRSFAEMSFEEKNRISHRAIAVRKLTNFLKDYKNQLS